MRLSVVVPTHNKCERLRLSLLSYVNQSCGLDSFELIVVADGCTDDTRKTVATFEQRLPIRCLETPWRGQASSRNHGAQAARGEYLAFVDDDVLLCPTYLEGCLEGLAAQASSVVRGTVYTLLFLRFFKDPEKGTPYPQFASQLGRGTRLRDILLTEAMILEDWPSIARQCRRVNRFERLVVKCLSAESAVRIPWVGLSGSGVALKRSVFVESGGYDLEFGRDWGAESWELGYRLWQAGVGFEHLADCYSAHMDHPRDESVRSFDKTFDYFYRKYQDPDIKRLKRLIFSHEEIDSALSEPPARVPARLEVEG